ncbi:hypothetical protein FOMG_16947 [Fusarium oxysporum f. sp. melonis 26406]|uniref:Uncharacterized protein n=1 Tax=Fusarium oxysporum f. sp. melonis 26406 TaxID=1089452 RepID=W9Z520_FUSOX|nr:hypothetical protein FOMG_16947 [Fusarium oxysporum f. sp. melonis 26406]
MKNVNVLHHCRQVFPVGIASKPGLRAKVRRQLPHAFICLLALRYLDLVLDMIFVS